MSAKAPLRDDPVWQQALDWCLRVQAVPQDRDLLAARDAWLAAHPDHERAYRRAEKVWRLTGDLPAAHTASVVPFVPKKPRRKVAIAAGALAACLALVMLPQARLALLADHRTSVGETARVALTDGSIVHLDAASAVATDLQPDRRAVTLMEGQAFFEVAHDPARPFTVTAGEVKVTVLGTAFDVRKGRETVSVAVRSGVVSVSAGGGDVRLTPGEQLVVRAPDGSLATQKISPNLVAPWMGGRLVVDGATIGDIVEEIGRYHPGLVVVRDEVLAQRRVTGVFDLSDPVAALGAVTQPHGGRINSWPYLTLLDRP